VCVVVVDDYVMFCSGVCVELGDIVDVVVEVDDVDIVVVVVLCE